MKNKLIVLLLTIVLVATFGVACTNIDTTPTSIKLVNFEATQTEEAICYGELYELRRVVTDENGNEYLLSYEVKDSTGANVSVIANCFEATDLGGYTITYSVEISEDDVRTSVVTLPVYDAEGPSIFVGELEAGEVDKLYVLPEITFNDLSTIEEKSVKVYLVGDELSEITLTENAGVYSFTPSQEGTYRLSVYAKDAAGNESTYTKDFFVETILVGEVLNPVSSKALSQVSFGTSTDVFSGATKEIVTAEENNDAIYGGSYMRMVATNPNGAWGNIMLSPRYEASAYAEYSLISVWVYVESTDMLPINVLFFNDAELTQAVNANEWTLVTLPADKFFTQIAAGNYFIAIRYNDKTTALRVGEILAVNPAELTISNIEDGVLEGESVNVEFTVSANPADTQYNVLVKNANGEALEVTALGEGKYQVTLNALGEYTVTVNATNGKHGSASASFAVVEPNRIVVDGTYASATGMGKEFTLLGALVQRGESVTEEQVTVKLYSLVGEEWVDITAQVADGKYTPATEGKLKVEYTCGEIAPVVYEIEVLDYSVVFDPSLEIAGDQIMFGLNNTVYQYAEKVFVTAEENIDETYGGAYFVATATNKIGWGNLWIFPRYTANEYSDWDLVLAWVYVVSDNNNTASASFANGHYSEVIKVNEWVQVAIPMASYIQSLDENVQVFIGVNYKNTGISAVRVGDIKAINSAELAIATTEETVLDGASVNVEFTVTATPAEAEYSVVVTSPSGAKLQAVALGEGKYQVVASEVGEYTVEAIALGNYYAKANASFAVVESLRLIVDGEYAKTTGFGKQLTIIPAHVQRGENPTEEQVTIKLYSLVGEEWVDVTAEIADGKYTPATEGKLKVEYTFEGVDAITYEIAVVDPTIVFDPASSTAASQISANQRAFNYGPNATFTFVSDEDNNDATYGGAYVKVGTTVALSSTKLWGNVLISPTSDLNSYSEYTTLYAWIYIEGVSASATVTFFNATVTKTLATNQWVAVDFAVADFIANGSNPFYGSNFFTDKWGITGVCFGKIFTAEPAELSIPAIEETVLDSASKTVEFSVTASPAETEYDVVVTSPSGLALTTVALGDGNYQVTASEAGVYTVKASAKNGKFGMASAQFTVKEPVELIVDGTYASTTGMGKELALIGAHIERSGAATEDVVTVKVYTLNGSEWVDVSAEIADGKYIPTAVGKIKVEYSFEGLDAIAYEITVVDPSIIFDPTSATASSQVSTSGNAFSHGNAATYTFVSDAENNDTTYGGAYVKVGSTALTTKNQWGNIFLQPNSELSSYSEYTKVSIWIYIERLEGGTLSTNILGGSASVTTNQWVQIEISMDQFEANSTNLFYGANFADAGTWGIKSVSIGQIVAVE